ncbi:MAG: nucleotidyltransferase family protein [Hyphomicrobiales bacterium]|nr:nucleotidyltransferase family protein [Hyphomicrobiales bacterium]
MVFAAGLGTRMRPITDTMPKPLVRIDGKTMLDHMLDRLAEAHIPRAIVNVHYHGAQIVDHLRGRKNPQIVISDETDKLLDQGGGIKKVLPLLGPAPFFICNTDAVWLERRPAMPAMIAQWRPQDMDILLLVADRVGSVGVDWPGDFHMDDAGRLTKRRDNETSDFVYAGVGIVKPQLFAHVEEDVFKLAPFFFEAARSGRLHGCRLDGLWLHVGAPQAIADAERAIARAR